MVGIDPASDGLERAARLGVADDGTRASTGWSPCRNSPTSSIVFDATSAGAHSTSRCDAAARTASG